jgi:hypothetical protein
MVLTARSGGGGGRLLHRVRRRAASSFPRPPPALRFEACAHTIPHPRKQHSEDAYFSNAWALGVADGVGSWAARGVDSGRYARGLMAGADRAVHEAADEGRLRFILPKPLLLLQAGYADMCAEQVPGSSTALVATLAQDRLLTAALGDSGLVVVRGGMLAHRTAETMHSWNYPFQLGLTSRDGPVTSLPVTACSGRLLALHGHCGALLIG